MNAKDRAKKLYDEYHKIIISGGSPDFIGMVAKAIEDKQTIPPECKTHKSYQGKRKPTNNCEDCWRLYLWRKKT